MSLQSEALDLKWDIIPAAVAVAVGGAVTALFVAGAHADHPMAVMILSSVVSLTGGLYSVHGAVKLMGPPSAAVVARAQRAQQREVLIPPRDPLDHDRPARPQEAPERGQSAVRRSTAASLVRSCIL